MIATTKAMGKKTNCSRGSAIIRAVGKEVVGQVRDDEGQFHQADGRNCSARGSREETSGVHRSTAAVAKVAIVAVVKVIAVAAAASRRPAQHDTSTATAAAKAAGAGAGAGALFLQVAACAPAAAAPGRDDALLPPAPLR